MKKAAVMISGGRMKVIVRELTEAGFEVLACTQTADLEEMEGRAQEWDALILPIRGINQEGNACIPGIAFPMEKTLVGLRPKAQIITGLQTDYLKHLQREVKCYFEDEQVRRKNVRLTAEGILYLLLKETTKSIFEQSIDLVGYGYVGQAAHELLEKLGIEHRIVDQFEKTMDDGAQVLSLENWKKTAPAEVIINSVPALVADEETTAKWPETTFFIDIASGAVGADSKTKERIHYLAAPPLPGLVAEESAGKILADYILRQFG